MLKVIPSRVTLPPATNACRGACRTSSSARSRSMRVASRESPRRIASISRKSPLPISASLSRATLSVSSSSRVRLSSSTVTVPAANCSVTEREAVSTEATAASISTRPRRPSNRCARRMPLLRLPSTSTSTPLPSTRSAGRITAVEASTTMPFTRKFAALTKSATNPCNDTSSSSGSTCATAACGVIRDATIWALSGSRVPVTSTRRALTRTPSGNALRSAPEASTVNPPRVKSVPLSAPTTPFSCTTLTPGRKSSFFSMRVARRRPCVFTNPDTATRSPGLTLSKLKPSKTLPVRSTITSRSITCSNMLSPSWSRVIACTGPRTAASKTMREAVPVVPSALTSPTTSTTMPIPRACSPTRWPSTRISAPAVSNSIPLTNTLPNPSIVPDEVSPVPPIPPPLPPLLASSMPPPAPPPQPPGSHASSRTKRYSKALFIIVFLPGHQGIGVVDTHCHITGRCRQVPAVVQLMLRQPAVILLQQLLGFPVG